MLPPMFAVPCPPSAIVGTTRPRLGESQHITDTSGAAARIRSEEHTSELQSLMRISYAVFCLKKKTTNNPKFPTDRTSSTQVEPSTTKPILQAGSHNSEPRKT